jgi:ribonuclease HI
MDKIIIYTDGSSRGNPGPGGYGAIVFDGENVKEMGGREERTTNNRMEMMAAIEALKNIPENFEIEIHTDSTYLIGGITIWIKNWQKNNWRTKDKREVLNKDLWQKLQAETEKRNIEWKKVLGHSGHEFNDRCDEIATNFADGKNTELYNGLKSGYKTVS